MLTRLPPSVNLTETNYALAMITKAGVPSNKVVVGVSSYGRSFGMTDPNCRGPMCTYTGPTSGALSGACTDTPGYLADAEINDLIVRGAAAYHDDLASDSDIAIFQGTWVAYMTQRTKNQRTSIYGANKFGGTVDWAIDLGVDLDGSLNTNPPGNGYGTSPSSATIESIPGCTVPAPGATFTIDANCAAGIANYPPSGRNNDPPGPDFCNEECNLWQRITATCCGIGGDLANPVVILPNVQIPNSVVLPPGYSPAAPFLIPERTVPAGVPIPYPLVIPAGTNLPELRIPAIILPRNKPLDGPVTIHRGQVPVFDVTITGTVYPKDVPIAADIILPIGFIPSTAFQFGPVILPAGPTPIEIILPAGYVPIVPFILPLITIIPGTPLIYPVIIPPLFVFPPPPAPPLIFPPPLPLRPIPPPPTTGPPPPPPVFPLPVTECAYFPPWASVIPDFPGPGTPTPTQTQADPDPTPTHPYPDLCGQIPIEELAGYSCFENCGGNGNAFTPCPPWCCDHGCQGFC